MAIYYSNLYNLIILVSVSESTPNCFLWEDINFNSLVHKDSLIAHLVNHQYELVGYV